MKPEALIKELRQLALDFAVEGHHNERLEVSREQLEKWRMLLAKAADELETQWRSKHGRA